MWWFLTDHLQIVKSAVMPGPVTVAKTLIKKLYDTRPDGSTLFMHMASSLKIALSGYGLGVLIGVPLGILMAWYKKADLIIRPVFDLIRTVPGIAWISIMIVLAGIGIFSKILVVFISAVTANVINAYSGIKQTKEVYLWVGQSFGASNTQLLLRFAIPSALPMILTGLKVSLSSAWRTLVAAELLASSVGIGFMIQNARGISRPDIIIVGMIVIGLMGAFLTWCLTMLEKLVLKGGRW